MCAKHPFGVLLTAVVCLLCAWNVCLHELGQQRGKGKHIEVGCSWGAERLLMGGRNGWHSMPFYATNHHVGANGISDFLTVRWGDEQG
eukprot:m.116105 g.116105  ORF g.116105 m.116105 type:complete len:88 (+) comp13592_c1_seq1:1249-1512(+)